VNIQDIYKAKTKTFLRYISLLVFLLIFSCKKWGNGYVEGHIYENGTGNPIANAKVKLISSHYGNQGRILGDVKTDINGYYKIVYRNALSGSWSYYVTVSNRDGYPNYQKQDITNKKEEFDFYFDPVAYVQFHVKNNTPNDFSLGLYSGNYATVLYLGGPGYIDKIYPEVLEVNGNGTTEISWDYLNNTYSDNVTINHKKDTLIYLIALN
jgi:5-hydroxyisourate hydrolase-like protein (transthyretin family)